MDHHTDAVAWVRERFDDPDYYLDARVRGHIARDPGFAGFIKEMITRPPAGLRCRVYIARPRDPDLATPRALQQLNGGLHESLRHVSLSAH